MKSSERRRALVQHVRDQGYSNAMTLAETFGVDGSTIRRDLMHLTRSGLIRRTHGGVLPAAPDSVIDTPYAVRKKENLAAKRAIARAAVNCIKDGQVIILDNGSTTYQIAEELRRRKNLTVITNDLSVGMCIASQHAHRLHITGGVLLDTVYTMVGPRAVEAFEGIHADWAFLGAEAVDASAGITNINVVEIPIKHAMMEVAAKLVFVADSTKFGRRAFATVCQIEKADLIITDKGLTEAERLAYGDKLYCA